MEIADDVALFHSSDRWWRRRAGAADQAGVEAAALRTQVRRVRAGAAEGGVRPQCADYEPVGWRCKCGAAVFDP
ncbi:hypothetical protein C2845_PM08G02690 [Panicum miliaceum]|uniref:Uncharacterized protein n=1 Tax=Panicum miliaceum TaxID=4540 RepID=A0A3L6QY47_PANMI|nr:hypothetical protein C2845_PM08G02690 [Panicum miliaceum]